MTTMKREVSSVAETSQKADAGWMQSAMDRIARIWIGQAILRQLDAFLWVVEKSAEWSLPQNEDETEESTKTDLVRPLPWMLFLPTLLFLRLIRASLNMGALMLGFPRVSSTSMMRFAQKSRYHLATVGKTSRSSEKMKHKRDTQATGRKSTTGSTVILKEEMREEPTKFATKSDVSTEPGRNDQLVQPEYNSHDVNVIDETTTKAEESYEERSYDDGQNEDGRSDEEESDEEVSDEEKQEKHEGDKGQRHKVECDQQDDDGKNEYDEEDGSKVECDKAECDLIEQIASLSTENNSPEKTSALSQDSDIHFFSPVESSASRSRSSSDSRDSSISNDTPRQSVSSSNISVQRSHSGTNCETISHDLSD